MAGFEAWPNSPDWPEIEKRLNEWKPSQGRRSVTVRVPEGGDQDGERSA